MEEESKVRARRLQDDPALRTPDLALDPIANPIEDIGFHRLTSADVVRHKLVGRIVAAYDEFDARAQQDAPRSGPPARTHRKQRS